jgi:hypothetical protein
MMANLEEPRRFVPAGLFSPRVSRVPRMSQAPQAPLASRNYDGLRAWHLASESLEV